MAGLRVGILGTGWGASVQAPLFRRAGLEVAALWGRNREKTERIAGELGIPRAVSRPEALIEADDLDLVSVVTPPHLHAELAMAALAAGKHVLCEKPTALNAAQAEAMLQAARRHPEQLSLIDHELRFLPVLGRMRQLLREGFAGKLLHLEAAHRSGGRLDPTAPWDWWSDASLGGGALGAIGSHLVDLLRWLTGRPVEAVSAVLARVVPERQDREGVVRPVTADDAAYLHLRFPDGLTASLGLSSGVAGLREDRVTAAGSEGTLVFDGQELAGHRRGQEEPSLREVGPPPDLPPGVGDSPWTRGTLSLARALRQALAGEREAIAGAADFADGLATQRVLDAARESAETGRWARVPGDPS